jgi:hypothetical protein
LKKFSIAQRAFLTLARLPIACCLLSVDKQQKNKKFRVTAPEMTTVLSSERKTIKSAEETKAASNKYSITFKLNNFFSSDVEDKFSILSEILFWFL